MEPQNLVTVTEATRLTGLHPQTLYRLARQGRVRAFKVLNRALRFERADLLGLARAKEIPTETMR